MVKLLDSKQKLQFWRAGFMKDKITLAFYNVSNNFEVLMEIKERMRRSKSVIFM